VCGKQSGGGESAEKPPDFKQGTEKTEIKEVAKSQKTRKNFRINSEENPKSQTPSKERLRVQLFKVSDGKQTLSSLSVFEVQTMLSSEVILDPSVNFFQSKMLTEASPDISMHIAAHRCSCPVRNAPPDRLQGVIQYPASNSILSWTKNFSLNETDVRLYRFYATTEAVCT
jgi:hypothetical protein